MLLSVLPVADSSLSFAAETSCSSEPYSNDRPDNEWTTAVSSGSCFWMASNSADRCSAAMVAAVDEKVCECDRYEMEGREKRRRLLLSILLNPHEGIGDARGTN